jgi:ankyrin repeat protein
MSFAFDVYMRVYAAAQEGHLQTLLALVAAGAALDQPTAEGDTPLLIAALVRVFQSTAELMYPRSLPA